MLLREDSSQSIESRKILFFACISTVAGFCALLFSSMEMIRQIGVFVASGLAYAFAISFLLSPISLKVSKFSIPIPKGARAVGFIAFILLTTIASIGFARLRWEESISNLEAADASIVGADLKLRERFGSNGSKTTIVSTGRALSDALQSQADLLDASENDPNVFALSNLLPTRSEIDFIQSRSQGLSDFFAAFHSELENDGYEADAFAAFFDTAAAFSSQTDGLDIRIEARLQALASESRGPLSYLLNSHDSFSWTLLTSESPASLYQAALRENKDSVTLSQRSLLNTHLTHTRLEMLKWGMLSIAIVCVIIVLSFGFKRGILQILIPVLSVALAVGIASFLQGSLNLFHLIGAFLGVALALDYALFSIASYRIQKPIPHSVWLSFGTTGAAFIALLASSIPVVRSLGMIVLMTTSFCILLLSLFRKYITPPNDAA